MSIFTRFVRRLALLGLVAGAAAAAGCGAGGALSGGTAIPTKSITTPPPVKTPAAPRRAEAAFILPADTNADNEISPLELSSYALAFLQGKPWPQGPSPISPLALSTAALIFLQSGSYHYDASKTPPFQLGAPGGQTVTVS